MSENFPGTDPAINAEAAEAAKSSGPISVLPGSFEEYRLMRSADLYERNAQLEEEASIDRKLGILNHESFMERLREATSETRRHGDELTSCLLFIDLDYFKAINDTAGHLAGDEVLLKVARLLRDETRQADAVGRLGGEEFGVLLYGSQAEDATLFVERIREQLAEIDRPSGPYQDSEPYVTASIGIIELRRPIDDIDAVYGAADWVMYQIKRQSRNGAAIVWLDEHADSSNYGPPFTYETVHFPVRPPQARPPHGHPDTRDIRND